MGKDIGRATCVEQNIQEETVSDATAAALAGEVDNNELETVHRTLYAAFAQMGQGFDPRGRFNTIKGPALDALRPLLTLLNKCGDKVEVCTAGLENGIKRYREFRPQVLFVDYYLGDDVPPTGEASSHKKTKARKASLGLLKEIVQAANGEDIPAIVLMSSHQVNNVDRYRHAAGSEQVMSLRFQFLNKGLVRQENQGIEIDHEAADVLLDTSQGYLFGKVLQQALTQWKEGAELALHDLLKEVGDLHMKDFAYLLRFRLREEGQPFSEYLEWLFGECLKGLINEKINWHHGSFSILDDDEKMDENIEGAFEGPSVKIASFFHRIRVNADRASAHRKYQLGDLYAQPKGSSIRAVITPDCDLVVRKGQTKAKSVLTMGGTLSTFNETGSAADDFFLRGNTPYSVRWNPKDLETFPINGKDALAETDKLQFLGTLRPLYAQETATPRPSRSLSCRITRGASAWDRRDRSRLDTDKKRQRPHESRSR